MYSFHDNNNGIYARREMSSYNGERANKLHTAVVGLQRRTRARGCLYARVHTMTVLCITFNNRTISMKQHVLLDTDSQNIGSQTTMIDTLC